MLGSARGLLPQSQGVLLSGETMFNLMTRCLLPSYFSHSFSCCLSSVFSLI